MASFNARRDGVAGTLRKSQQLGRVHTDTDASELDDLLTRPAIGLDVNRGIGGQRVGQIPGL